MHVCEHEIFFIRCTLKCDAGLATNDAMHTVTANQPRRIDVLCRAVLTNVHVDVRGVCLEADDLTTTEYAAAEFFDMVEQTSLDPILRAHQRETVVAVDLREIDGQERAITITNAKDRNLDA